MAYMTTFLTDSRVRSTVFVNCQTTFYTRLWNQVILFVYWEIISGKVYSTEIRMYLGWLHNLSSLTHFEASIRQVENTQVFVHFHEFVYNFSVVFKRIVAQIQGVQAPVMDKALENVFSPYVIAGEVKMSHVPWPGASFMCESRDLRKSCMVVGQSYLAKATRAVVSFQSFR